MNWDELPYWARGGIKGSILCIVLLIVVSGVDYMRENPQPTLALFILIGIVPVLLCFNHTLSMCTLAGMRIQNEVMSNEYMLLITIVSWFSIGALIGAGYGKIKNKETQINE